jgi:hypothetical protein
MPLLQATEAGIGVAATPFKGLVEGNETIPGPDKTLAHVIEQSVGGLDFLVNQMKHIPRNWSSW